MGCNSHLAIEFTRDAKPKDGTPPWWRAWAVDIEESRDYGMYAALAGVRGDAEPVVPVRGYPKDMSYQAKRFFGEVDQDENPTPGGGDYHTPTWLTPAEYRDAYATLLEARKQYAREHPDKPAFGIADEWRLLANVLAILADTFGEEGVRLIIAFDN
jgi:hypothetical protein